ncbi:arabinan endo-1,5-alpha-L-arabinosidase [Bacteroidales bacterium]|nr:arabinan endo-1,5-alpha-L-arabinosidase [Bacteroidales bacterium]
MQTYHKFNCHKVRRLACILLFVPLLFFILSSFKKGTPQKEEQRLYTNPVVDVSLPDPSIIRDADGTFYLYATENTRNVPIYKSSNLVDWSFVGTAFNDQSRPTFEEKGAIWAPDINFIDGQYVLYYSMSVWGGEWTCGIGLATAKEPQGPFVDHGKLFRSNEIAVQNSIDPFYIEQDDKKFLFWGSFSGIYAIQLSQNGLLLMSEAQKQQVAGSAYEGVYIHKKDDYYYLFASIGSCCEGVKSTYTTVVGRSKQVLGPYLNKQGASMMDNQHEVILSKNAHFVGAGHNSEIVQDEDGKDWFLYHAVDLKNPSGRVLMLDEIKWVEGWPSINDGSPSSEYKIPRFLK